MQWNAIKRNGREWSSAQRNRSLPAGTEDIVFNAQSLSRARTRARVACVLCECESMERPRGPGRGRPKHAEWEACVRARVSAAHVCECVSVSVSVSVSVCVCVARRRVGPHRANHIFGTRRGILSAPCRRTPYPPPRTCTGALRSECICAGRGKPPPLTSLTDTHACAHTH